MLTVHLKTRQSREVTFRQAGSCKVKAHARSKKQYDIREDTLEFWHRCFKLILRMSAHIALQHVKKEFLLRQKMKPYYQLARMRG